MPLLTDHAENKVIDALFRGQALGAPTTWYLALSTAVRSDSGTPTEPSGKGYARVAVVANLDNFKSTQGAAGVASSGTTGATSNAVAITFPESTGSWGTIKSAWFMSAATGGNAWMSIDLTTQVAVSGGDFTLSFAAGKLSGTINAAAAA
ncbi:MAG: hypothetical protein LBL72_08370 [Candidatus Accumulibacter sp.]|jgi:hypothetical protein|nr:hypothetical protein [Accumulibacter sp.]